MTSRPNPVFLAQGRLPEKWLRIGFAYSIKQLSDKIVSLNPVNFSAFVELHLADLHELSEFQCGFEQDVPASVRLSKLRVRGRTDDELKADLVDHLCVSTERLLRGLIKTIAAVAGIVFIFDNRASTTAGIVLSPLSTTAQQGYWGVLLQSCLCGLNRGVIRSSYGSSKSKA